MSAERIRDAAAALLGPEWTRPQLAQALDWDLRRVQRWCSGSEEPPPVIWMRLRSLLREKSARIAIALEEMPDDREAEAKARRRSAVA